MKDTAPTATNDAIPTTRFDLQDLPEQDRFAVWKESISVVFDVSLEDRDTEKSFTSRLTTWSVSVV
jgi:hypothetical protein